MRTFTKIVEDVKSKRYFEISSELTFLVESDSEGEAGYKADTLLGSIKHQKDFTIVDIKEVEGSEYEKLLENVESPSWIEKDGYLQRNFEFNTFTDSIKFVNEISKISEENQHHPKIAIDFNQVKLLYKTNKENSITDLDHKMAKKSDDLYKKIY